MPEVEGWANTMAAQTAYAGLEVHPGQWFFSLLLVLGLLALAAWMLKRRGFTAHSSSPAPGKIIFISQWNQRQKLVLWDLGRTLRCLITRGNQIELMAEIPVEAGVRQKNAEPAAAIFRELWRAWVEKKGRRQE